MAHVILYAVISLIIEMYIPFVKLKRIIGVESNTSIDSVCKITVDEKTAKLRSEHKERHSISVRRMQEGI